MVMLSFEQNENIEIVMNSRCIEGAKVTIGKVKS